VTMASAALLLAASQVDRLTWAAQMVGVDDRMAARTIAAWRMNREVKAMASRLEPQIRKVA
jgi:hypothetical protein